MEKIQTTIAILGAGFSGIGAAIKLKEAGITDFIVVERANEIGGTWRDNNYPGVACDVPANLYSFSFEPNPDWARTYAEGPQIQQYLLHCAQKYDVRGFVRFGLTVNQLSFDTKKGTWLIQTENGIKLEARFVISAMGPLANPKLPVFPGIDSFKGEVVHSARWPKDFSATDKNIVVIGTGASAIQIVPAIAQKARKLTVIQRSAPWILPKPDQMISPRRMQFLRQFPLVQRLQRYRIFIAMELLGPFVYARASFFKKRAEKFALSYLAKKIANPDLRRKCTPDYRIGCKRILFTSDWFPTLSRPNVELGTEPVKSIVSDGVVLANNEIIPCNAIICATGFEAPTQGTPFPILGRDGLSLDALWKDGAYAYKGMTVSGFPNLFFELGPNTGPGHTSVLIYVEAQLGYIIEAIKSVIGKSDGCLELKEDVQTKYNQWLNRRMNKMIWTHGSCHSWYLTKEGRNTSLYPGPAAEYSLRARSFKISDYKIFAATTG